MVRGVSVYHWKTENLYFHLQVLVLLCLVKKWLKFIMAASAIEKDNSVSQKTHRDI